MGLWDRIQAAKAREPGPAAQSDEPVVEPPPRPKQEWGKPGRCPECSGQGYLDHIDLVDRIMYQHCKECGHRWQINQADILAQG